MKTLEQCRATYAPVFAMLPPQVNATMQGIERRQDAMIAELYSGKITFGEYNIATDRIIGELASLLSGIKQSPQTASSPAALERKSAETVTMPRSRPTEVNPAPKATVSHAVRVALVIGDSNYIEFAEISKS